MHRSAVEASIGRQQTVVRVAASSSSESVCADPLLEREAGDSSGSGSGSAPKYGDSFRFVSAGVAAPAGTCVSLPLSGGDVVLTGDGPDATDMYTQPWPEAGMWSANAGLRFRRQWPPRGRPP